MYNIYRYDVIKGEKIVYWNNNISFGYNPTDGRAFTDYLANDLNWFIISRVFKETLEKNNITGLQYLSVNLLNEATRETTKEYYLANVYNLIDALDLTNSKYSSFKNTDGSNLISVSVYTLKNDMVKDIDIFRLKNSNIPIFISDRLRKIIRNNKITGCDFLQVKVI